MPCRAAAHLFSTNALKHCFLLWSEATISNVLHPLPVQLGVTSCCGMRLHIVSRCSLAQDDIRFTCPDCPANGFQPFLANVTAGFELWISQAPLGELA